MNTLTYKSQREDTWLPVAVALLLSLLLHVVVFSGMLKPLHWHKLARHMNNSPTQPQPEEKQPEKKAQKKKVEDHILLGKEKADDIITMNWIGYDAFEKLIAMPSKTQQAAFQRLADPIQMPDADAQVDPATDMIVKQHTTPRPQSAPQEPSPSPQVVQDVPTPPAKPQKPVDSPMKQAPTDMPEQQASPKVDPSAIAKVVPVPVITPKMDIPQKIAHEQPVMSEHPQLAMLPQTDVPHKVIVAPNPEAVLPKRVDPTPPQQQTQQDKPAAESKRHQERSIPQPYNADQLADRPRPTNVPREDRESQPYSLDHHKITGKIGGVLVGKGVEILTRLPRFSAVTQASIWPKANPVVEITFATDGVVIEADIIRSSGYAGIDSPILASVYHWKAKGEILKKLARPIKRKFTFKLIDDSIE